MVVGELITPDKLRELADKIADEERKSEKPEKTKQKNEPVTHNQG
jgi:hypothetical protein